MAVDRSDDLPQQVGGVAEADQGRTTIRNRSFCDECVVDRLHRFSSSPRVHDRVARRRKQAQDPMGASLDVTVRHQRAQDVLADA